MSNINIVNSLSGLLILTSLMVIEAKNSKLSAMFYSIQSMVLVLIFLALAITMQAWELFLWAATAFVTKVVLAPLIIYGALPEVRESDMPKNVLSPAASFVLAAVVLALAFPIVNQYELQTAAHFKPALAISIAHFFFGVLCILTQRNILKQLLGYCLMENGSHLTLALMAYKAPEVVEIGIVTDALIGVAIMVFIGKKIYQNLHTLDVADLNMLKG